MPENIDVISAEPTSTPESSQVETEVIESGSGDAPKALPTQSIPYNRFKEVISESREKDKKIQELYTEIDNLSKKAPQGQNGDSINAQLAQKARNFKKEGYQDMNDFYVDFVQNLVDDDSFIDMLFEKKGDKVEDWLYKTVNKRQERTAREAELAHNKVLQENNKFLEEKEYELDEQTYTEFLKFARAEAKFAVEAGLSIQQVYKMFEKQYTPTNIDSAVDKIATGANPKAKRESREVDLSADFRDILRQSMDR